MRWKGGDHTIEQINRAPPLAVDIHRCPKNQKQIPGNGRTELLILQPRNIRRETYLIGYFVRLRPDRVADIPQLAKVPPGKFAVAVTTVDGQQFSFGDSSDFFGLQVRRVLTSMLHWLFWGCFGFARGGTLCELFCALRSGPWWHDVLPRT